MKQTIFCLLIIIFSVYPQNMRIAGRVLESGTGLPLERATVLVSGTAFGTLSDARGFFIIEGLPNREFECRISYMGYYSKEISLSPKSNDTIVVFLEKNVLPSQSILISANLPSRDNQYVTYQKLGRGEIQASHTVQDVPQFLADMPSVVSYSEGGNGIGYNYLSLRGFDQRRIAVLVNGIPQNDPEDHNVYWLDFNDILSSADFIQVQRGAGGGIFGYPAVGGAINIITNSTVQEPGVEVSAAYGDYHTRKTGLKYATGLIDNKYSFTTKLSQTISSGYREMSGARLSAFYFGISRFDNRLTTQLNFYGGPLEDALVYTGLPKAFIGDRNRRKSNYSYWEYGSGALQYAIPRRDIEKENFSQPHFELLQEYKINNGLTLNSALFVVFGEGFFDYDASWGWPDYFRLPSTANIQNALIRAQVENKQFGWLPRINLKMAMGELNAGLEFRKHTSLHWGSLLYGTGIPQQYDSYHRFYSYEGGKDIYSGYINQTLEVTSTLKLMGELHLTTNAYRLKNEKFVGTDFTVKNTFFNFRAGLNYEPSQNINLYFSYAKVSREPRLKNYYDAAESGGGETPQFEMMPDGSYDFSKPFPKPETMNSFEAGLIQTLGFAEYTFNFYYMYFSDEIVKNGKLDKFGSPKTGNVESTLHAGAELSAILKPWENLQIRFNATISRNRILSGKEYLQYSMGNIARIDEVKLDGNRIGGFPDVLLGSVIEYNAEPFLARFTARFTDEFLSDNYEKNFASLSADPGYGFGYADNKNDPFFTADVFFSLNIRDVPFADAMKVYVQVNNVFDALYSQYAIGKEFFPGAERNFLTGISVGF